MHNIITQKDSSPRIAKYWRHKTQNIYMYFYCLNKTLHQHNHKNCKIFNPTWKFARKFSSRNKLVNMWPSSTKRCFTFLQNKLLTINCTRIQTLYCIFPRSRNLHQCHSISFFRLNFFNKLPWQDNATPSSLKFHRLAKSQNFDTK